MGEVTFEVQLGSCFYGGLDCDAVYVGRKDGDSGWISVCEEHKSDAEQDGYELMEPQTSAEVSEEEAAAATGAGKADSDSDGKGGDTAET